MPRDILHCQLSLSLKALENVEPENRDGQWTKTCWMLRMETWWGLVPWLSMDFFILDTRRFVKALAQLLGDNGDNLYL